MQTLSANHASDDCANLPHLGAAHAPVRIIPLADGFLDRVRAGLDDLDQPVERHLAQGGEPLRDCLRRAQPGEAILLASHTPFKVAGPYQEYGPVFVAATPQAPPALDRLPVTGGTPYLSESFVLRAYSPEQRIVDALVSSPHLAAAHLDRLFGRADVAFVLARFTAYGCYALRLARP
jgi:hypothetical protein